MKFKLPKTLRVGGYPFRVTETPAEEDHEGECDTTTKEINVKTVGRSAKFAANSLLHEAMHGIFYEAALHRLPGLNYVKEEQIVNAMANGVCRLIQENPEFAKQLFNAWRK